MSEASEVNLPQTDITPKAAKSPSKLKKVALTATTALTALTLLATPSATNKTEQLQSKLSLQNPKDSPEINQLKAKFIRSHVLSNWVKERGLLNIFESNARQEIANAIMEDISYMESGLTIDKTGIELIAGKAMAKLEVASNSGPKKIRAKKTDSVTKENFTTELEIETDPTGEKAYAAREVRDDGSKISEARLSSDGDTELTLDFTGPAYRNANPDISADHRFPKATATTFSLLVDSALK